MSQMNQAIYDAKLDPAFQAPYIDIDEWREGAVRYHYIHGGFRDTDTRFAFFFPEKEAYTGRFFQYMCPVPGNENAAMAGTGEEDKIAFAIGHGAYYVESNMGVPSSFGPIADPTIIYRASAAAAEYSRQVAAELFGPHRPYGYLFGGSGGGYKTMSCIENANAWDGAVPYVIGSPMALPNVITSRAHAMRILRDDFPQIKAAMEPGGSGDPYATLGEAQHQALLEVSRLGFPLKAWTLYDRLDDGSLPVLAPGVRQSDPDYFTSFWTKPGYHGTEPWNTAVRDRLSYETTVTSVYAPQSAAEEDFEDRSGVDDAWQRLTSLNSADKPWVRLAKMPENGAYTAGLALTVTSGAAKGHSFAVERVADDRLILGSIFGQEDSLHHVGDLQPGDAVALDNADYIAIQTYHRHQVPKEAGYEAWDQFRDAKGAPLYPQRAVILGPSIARSGTGSNQTGHIQCKVIVVAALMDESAYPWQADWYRQQVAAYLNGQEADCFRLWYVDNALHGDGEKPLDPLRLVGYLGALHQALLDVSDWVERGITPPATTNYVVVEGQVVAAQRAADRLGIQPVVNLTVHGERCATVRRGTAVTFAAHIELPPQAGLVTSVAWSFEGEEDFPYRGTASTEATMAHTFDTPGVYFPAVRVSAQRTGDAGDLFTQVTNLDRVQVIVT